MLHQGVGRPANLSFKAPQSGDLYTITSSRFQMILFVPTWASSPFASPLHALTSPVPPSPAGSMSKICIQLDCFAPLYHQHLARGSSSLPRQWGSFQVGLQLLQSPVLGHKFESYSKSFILPIVISRNHSSFLHNGSQWVITCFLLPLFSYPSSPLTCLFHGVIRPTLYTSAAPSIVAEFE